MGGLLSKNVTSREFADRKAVFSRPEKMVTLLSLCLRSESRDREAGGGWGWKEGGIEAGESDADFIQATELFAFLAGRQFRERN